MAPLILSADDHVDMSTLPPDLFQSRLAPRWREAGPKVVQGPDSMVWEAEGRVLGLSGTRHNTVGMAYATTRAGREEDGFRPSTPALRLADMDVDGIYAQVIYGPPLGFPLQDPALQSATLSAFNDWSAEFNSHAPERLCVLPILPVQDPSDATEELQRVAALGHRGAMFHVFQATPLPWDAAWDPLWSAAEETGLPISIHLGGGMSLLKRQPGSWVMAAIATVSPLQLDEAFAGFVLGGTLDRHPRMKLVLTESGIGWLPYFLERLDLQYHKYFTAGYLKDGLLSRLPSEIFHQQGMATFEEDRTGVSLIPRIGEDNVMWASDYPHPDSTFPNSRLEIEEAFAGLPESVKRKATRDNCAALYGFKLPPN